MCESAWHIPCHRIDIGNSGSAYSIDSGTASPFEFAHYDVNNLLETLDLLLDYPSQSCAGKAYRIPNIDWFACLPCQ